MKRKLLLLAIVVLLVAAGGWALLARDRGEEVSYRFVAVERGDLEAVVSATGTLSAVTTVEVGTQVSGPIAAIYADFNDQVKEGQVIARLDTTLLETALEDTGAMLERNKVELRQAERDYERIASLHKDGISADADYNKAQYNLELARASVRSAEATVARARQNLAYATITAPVSGTVVQRAVDVGQTVAASLSAPKLFSIANDLSQMQILAAVDESDIGRIKEGQDVRFTVKAYPDRTYTGRVKQVRLQSTSEQNVVSYTVVVDVANSDRSLLPGMTATVEFLVERARDVLKVANSALRFRPTEAMQAELRARREQARREGGERAAGAGGPGGTAGGGPQDGAPGQRPGRAGNGNGHGDGNGAARRAEPTMLYFLDEGGRLTARPVRTGITDGQSTEVRGRDLTEGLQVIAGVTQKSSQQTSSGNPFQPQQQQGGRRPMGPGGF